MNHAARIIDAGFTDDTPATGPATNTGTPTTGSTWNWNSFFNAFTHLADTAADAFGRPKYENYPQPVQQPVNPIVVYGGMAIVVLLFLALMAKILK